MRNITCNLEVVWTCNFSVLPVENFDVQNGTKNFKFCNLCTYSALKLLTQFCVF